MTNLRGTVFCLALLVVSAPFAARAGTETINRATRVVKGTFTTHVVPCEGLCTESKYAGDLAGTSQFTLISLESTRDPDVSRYTGNLVLHTAAGDLVGQDVGYWNTATGEYIDTYQVSGGTGAYAGVRGTLHLQGTLDPVTGTGSSTYVGALFFPCH